MYLTINEIKRFIETLEELKKTVPPVDLFGDNHIDFAIGMLKAEYDVVFREIQISIEELIEGNPDKYTDWLMSITPR